MDDIRSDAAIGHFKSRASRPPMQANGKAHMKLTEYEGFQSAEIDVARYRRNGTSLDVTNGMKSNSRRINFDVMADYQN